MQSTDSLVFLKATRRFAPHRKWTAFHIAGVTRCEGSQVWYISPKSSPKAAEQASFESITEQSAPLRAP